MGEGEDLCVGIRPEDMEVSDAPVEGGWPARLTLREHLGARMLITLRAGDEEARALVGPADRPEAVWMRWPSECLHWFEAGSGRRLG